MAKKSISIAGYAFKDENLFILALTHSSIANEDRQNYHSSNERLEFLGDSVLGLLVGAELYNKYPKEPEGALSRMRAHIVSEEALCKFAKDIALDKKILLGKGEEKTGGREKSSIMADAFEAVLGAVFLDSDLQTAKSWLLGIIGETISENYSDGYFNDYKTKLQEIVQDGGNAVVSYQLLSESGPAHERVFEVNVLIGDKVIATGKGKSKKEAEQKAALSAIKIVTK